MKAAYDFGFSQEDFKTEQAVLDLQPGDRLLCIASGGEVPLNLLCSHRDVEITAVDISAAQIYLCRLKLLAALHINFPLNGYFLGYGNMNKKQRITLFQTHLFPLLTEEEKQFWVRHRAAIEKGVINAGRFERYLRQLQWMAKTLIGTKNIRQLLACTNLEEQQALFAEKITTRKSVRLLFQWAFHPAVYRNRGLQAKALQHATEDTGKKYFNSFRNFCTTTPAKRNYFLHYFLLGACQTPEAFPDYLHEEGRTLLAERAHRLCFQQRSFVDVLQDNEKGFFNKVHLSNIGDWLSEEEFQTLWHTLKESLPQKAKLCYRFLQKDHFCGTTEPAVTLHRENSLQEQDRFPFYSTLAIDWHATV